VADDSVADDLVPGEPEPPAAAVTDPLPGVPVVSDPEPAARPAAADRGAWGAATDPIGQAARPAARPPRAAPASPRPASRPASRPADRSPARPATGQPGRAVSRPGQSRQPDTRRPDSRRSAPSGDMLSDLQRWLLRSGAKSMRREIEGQVRRTFNGGKGAGGGRGRGKEDIWGTATTEPPPGVGESPECQWCPICRAARRMRESGPGLGSQLSSAPSVVASAVQDAIVAFDTVLSRTVPAPGQDRPADRSPGSGPADSASDPAEGPQDEPGDRR
jgi:hypothetical protein